MIDAFLASHAERELKYQVRKQVSQEIRKNCPDGEPMVSEITVMLGTVIAMAAFCSMLGRNGSSRYR
jgi:hypothetical protein